MQQFNQFIINHSGLWLAFFVTLIAIIINEWITKKNSAKEISPQGLVGLINDDKATIFDVRDIESFQKGHIINAKRVSAEDFTQPKMNEHKNKPFILVCAKGLHSKPLATKLRANGYAEPLFLSGGLDAWTAADLPLVKGK